MRKPGKLFVTSKKAFIVAAILLIVIGISIGCTKPESQPGSEIETRLDLPKGFEKAEEVITTDLITKHVAALSSDEMEGRGPGSQGDQRARQYLADQMTELGLQPGFEGAWEQPMTLVGIDTSAPATWSFSP